MHKLYTPCTLDGSLPRVNDLPRRRETHRTLALPDFNTGALDGGDSKSPESAMNKSDAHSEMLATLEQLQREIKEKWLIRSLPVDWNALDHWHPVTPHKTRVTIRLDSDMVRWFRKLGPGYSTRMNMVLRLYWTALLSGEIDRYFQDDTIPQLWLQAEAMEREINEGVRRKPRKSEPEACWDEDVPDDDEGAGPDED